MSTFVWPSDAAVMALHEEMIAEFGGRPGTCNAALLAIEIKRPINMTLFEEPDAAALAAAYAAGFARHPPFSDGNTRTAFLVMNLFLALNDYVLKASDRTCIDVMKRLATGALEEVPLAAWLRDNIAPSKVNGPKVNVVAGRKAPARARTVPVTAPKERTNTKTTSPKTKPATSRRKSVK
jgi:death on curing protein